MFTTTKAHKIKLNPTPEQEAYFRKAAGVARFAFNWGLVEYNRRLEAKQKVSGRMLKKEFNAIKAEQYPWVSEVTTWAYQGAFDDLQSAFRRFFDLKKKGQLEPPKGTKPRKDGKPFGWPRFKSRHKTTPSFYLANTAMKFDGHKFLFDKDRVGWIDMYEKLRFDGKILGGRVSYQHDSWWLSVQVEIKRETPQPKPGVVGVDLGIKYLAVTSDGKKYHNPKPLEVAQRKLRRLQRKLDRQARKNDKSEMLPAREQSNNWHKTQAKIAKLHYRVACIRNDAAHKLTTEIAQGYGVVGLEDLNIKGMVKNGRLSKALSDAALYEKRRQLEYKTAWNGGTTVTIDRWFPSSKICSGCGEINAELKLGDREWVCTNCGQVNHRDENAAINIKNEAIRLICGTSPEELHGDEKRLNANQPVTAVVEEK